MHYVKHRTNQKHASRHGEKHQRNDAENLETDRFCFVFPHKYAAVDDEPDKNVNCRSDAEHHHNIAARNVVLLEDEAQKNTQPYDTRKDYEQYVCLSVATHLFRGVRFCDF